jgi:TonB family protein
MKGHVVITFNIHRNGAITDIEVRQPSHIESFNQAAVNALMSSNPTQPLPPEYPSDTAFFTVTFLYNEDPADFR